MNFNAFEFCECIPVFHLHCCIGQHCLNISQSLHCWSTGLYLFAFKSFIVCEFWALSMKVYFLHKSWIFYMKLYIYSTYSQPLIWETVCSTMNIIARFLVSFVCLSRVTFSYDLCFTFPLLSDTSDNRSGRNTGHSSPMYYLYTTAFF